MARSFGQLLFKNKLITPAIILLFVGFIVVGVHLLRYYTTHVSTDDAFVEGHVSPVTALVTGTVLKVLVDDNEEVEKGQTLVELDPKYYRAKLEQAKAAVAIADSELQAATERVLYTRETVSGQVGQAEAELQAASMAVQTSHQVVEQTKAIVASKRAALSVAEAELKEAVALEEKAKLDYDRMQHLLQKQTISQQEFDVAKSSFDASSAQAAAAKQKVVQAKRELEATLADLKAKELGYAYSPLHLGIESAKAKALGAEAKLVESRAKERDVKIREAQRQLAEARLQEARANLEYARNQYEDTIIRAPVSGQVTKKTVEVGQVAHPGQPLMSIVPQEDIWVVANFKETQLTHVRPGQKVEITVDTYPGEVFTGTVHSIQAGTGARFSLLPPENATGNFVKVVQRIPVKIVLDKLHSNPHTLRPGMSVVPTVEIR